MRVFFLLIAALLFAPTLIAQPKLITEVELVKIKNEAMRKRARVPLRVRRWVMGPGTGSSESFYEYSRNDTFHFVYLAQLNGVEKRTESIQIGPVKYLRNADGTWTKNSPPVTEFDLSGYGSSTGKSDGKGDGSGPGDSSGPVASPEGRKQTAEHFYLGKEVVNGQETDHYRTVRTITHEGKETLSRKSVDDQWIGADGLTIKETFETSWGDVLRFYSTRIEYEYPKEIIIVAPIPD